MCQAVCLCLRLIYRDQTVTAFVLYSGLLYQSISASADTYVHVTCKTSAIPYVSSLFIPHRSVRGQSSLWSASSGKFVVPVAHLLCGWCSFTVAGPSISNSIPAVACDCLTETIFHSSKLMTYSFSLFMVLNISGCTASVCTSEIQKGMLLIWVVLSCIARMVLYPCVDVYVSTVNYAQLKYFPLFKIKLFWIDLYMGPMSTQVNVIAKATEFMYWSQEAVIGELRLFL